MRQMGSNPCGSFVSFGSFGSSLGSCSSTSFPTFNLTFGSSTTSWGVGSDSLYKSSIRNSPKCPIKYVALSESIKSNKKFKTNENFGNQTNNNESGGTYWDKVLHKNSRTKETSAKTEDKKICSDSDR